MNISEVIAEADKLFQHRQLHLAFRAYLTVVNYFRKNRKKKNMKLDENILTAYNNAIVIGIAIANSKNFLIEIRDMAREFVKLSKKTSDSEMYAVACLHAGIAHSALQEYDKAIPLLEDALVVFELIGRDDGLMLACKYLAKSYEATGDVTKSQIYLNRATALSHKLGENGENILKDVRSQIKKLLDLPWLVKP